METRRRLIEYAVAMGQHATNGWYACQEKVPVSELLSIEMKTWTTPWQDITLDKVLAVEDDALTFEAGGRSWWAVRKLADGRLHYICKEGEIE